MVLNCGLMNAGMYTSASRGFRTLSGRYSETACWRKSSWSIGPVTMPGDETAHRGRLANSAALPTCSLFFAAVSR
jgi:hypothetical protein